MSRIIIAAAFALAVTLSAVTANAQGAIRTFVSITGSDTNACTITQPCRHFQAAVNATAVGGEVDALEPGAYGSFMINQAVTIEGQGWSYVAPGPNYVAITVNSGSGDVNIHGVSLNGVGVESDPDTGGAPVIGIQFNFGSTLNVRDSAIQNFQGDGIQFLPSSSSQLFVSNTVVSGNTGNGVLIGPSAGTITGTLDHVQIENNGGDGLSIYHPDAQSINMTVSESVIANNANDGIDANDLYGPPTGIVVRNCTIANNGSSQQSGSDIGVSATGGNTTMWVTRSTITGNTVGLYAYSSATIYSYGDNIFVNNGSSNRASSIVGGYQ